MGNFIKPFMTEATKDIYRYFFKGGRKYKKTLKNIDLIKRFMSENKGTHDLSTIKMHVLPKYSEDEIHNILKKAQELDGRFQVFWADNKPSWRYNKISD